MITGTLENITREEAQAALEALGAKVADNVLDEDDGLIVGEDPGKSKLTKAEKAGVPAPHRGGPARSCWERTLARSRSGPARRAPTSTTGEPFCRTEKT